MRSRQVAVAALSLGLLAAATTAAGGLGAADAVVARPVTSAHAVPPAASDDAPMLGLPRLSTAQRYVLAPPTRTVAPVRVTSVSRVNHDYVSADAPVSETSAHGLRPGTSDVATVGGARVRRAGVGRAGGWFSYDLRVTARRAVTLRVEEAGSADARYQVVVGGRVVHRRVLDLYAAQGRPVGPTAYTLRVPRSLVTSGRLRVTFRNDARDPGDGARIAGVWAEGDRDAGLAEYGGTVTAPAGAAREGRTTMTSDFFGRPYAVYDFGREVAGTVRVDLSGVRGRPRLGLAFSESRTFTTSYSDYSQDPSGVATETHYLPARDGRLADPVIRGGFRYLMVFLDRPGRVTLERLRLRFTGDAGNPAPAEYAGAFLSSDDQLNRLWYAGAYTTQLSTIASDTGRPYPATPGPVRNDVRVAPGQYFLSDGAKRDRYDWGGDNVVSNVVAYLSTARTRPAQNSLDWFAAHPSEAGQVPGVYLPEPAGFNYSWGEYAGWWTQNYWTHYLYTGDRAYLERWFPALVDNVAWFESAVGDDGLWDVPADAGGHWGYGQSGKEAYDNVVYVHSLTSAVAAAEAVGRDDLAEQWRGQAERTAAAVNDLLWDDDAGAYRALPGSPGHPLDANALAVASGVAPPERAERVLAFVRENLRTPYGDRAVDTTEGNAVPDYISPFVAGHELLAHSRVDDTAGAVDVLRRTWGHMLRGDTTGTLWETVGPRGELGLGSYTSMSHGWSASPTVYLTHETLGVTPTAPGFDTFDVSPAPPAGVDWAQGRVPTPHGDVRTAWRRTDTGFRLVVEAPPGTSYTAAVPTADGDRVRVDGAAVQQSDLTGLTGRTVIEVTR